jgi:hypothetical protein
VHNRAAARTMAARAFSDGVGSRVRTGHRAGTVPQFSRKYNS